MESNNCICIYPLHREVECTAEEARQLCLGLINIRTLTEKLAYVDCVVPSPGTSHNSRWDIETILIQDDNSNIQSIVPKDINKRQGPSLGRCLKYKIKTDKGQTFEEITPDNDLITLFKKELPQDLNQKVELFNSQIEAIRQSTRKIGCLFFSTTRTGNLSSIWSET